MAAEKEVEKLDAYQSCETINAALLKAQDDLARYRSQVYNLEALLINCDPYKRKDVLKTTNREEEKDKLFLLQKLQSVLSAQLLLQKQVKILQEQMGHTPNTGETRAKLRNRSKAVVGQVSDMQAQMRTLQGQIAGLAAQKGFAVGSGDREVPRGGSNNNNSERGQETGMTGHVAENFRSLTKQIKQLRAAAETYLERTAPNSGNSNNSLVGNGCRLATGAHRNPAYGLPAANRNQAYGPTMAANRSQGYGPTMAANRSQGYGPTSALNRNNTVEMKGRCCGSKFAIPMGNPPACVPYFPLAGDAGTGTLTPKAVIMKTVSTKRSQTSWSALTMRTVASQSELLGSELSHTPPYRSCGTQADFQAPELSNRRVQTEPPPRASVAVQSEGPNTRSRAVQSGGRSCTHCGVSQESRRSHRIDRRPLVERYCCPSDDEWD